MYQVTKKVPVPTDYQLRINIRKKPKIIKEESTRERFPFSKLKEPAMSFAAEDVADARAMRNAVRYATLKYNHRYITRTLPEGGARVWRVK